MKPSSTSPFAWFLIKKQKQCVLIEIWCLHLSPECNFAIRCHCIGKNLIKSDGKVSF